MMTRIAPGARAAVVRASIAMAVAGCGPLNPGLQQGIFGQSRGAGNASAVGETAEQAHANPGGGGLKIFETSMLERNACTYSVAHGGTVGEQRMALSLLKAAERAPDVCPSPEIKDRAAATQQELYESSVKMLAAGCSPDVAQYKPSDYRTVLWDQPGYVPSADEMYAALLSCPNNEPVCGDLAKGFDANTYGHAALDDASLDAPRRLRRFSGPITVRATLQREQLIAKVNPRLEKLRVEWKETVYPPHKAELDAALAYILAATRVRPAEGKSTPPSCGPELRKSLVDYVASQKPKSTVEVEQIMRDPVGGVLLHATMLCDIARKDTLAAAASSFYLGTPFLGARTYAREMLRDPQRTTQDDNAAGSWTGTTASAWPDFTTGLTPLWGVIDKVEDQGDKVRLTFKVVSLGKEYFTDNCWSTNKIESISANGRVNYEEKCTGHVEEVRGAEGPVFIAKALAAGLAPGRYLAFHLDRLYHQHDDAATRPAVPVHVDEKKIPVAAFGFPIEGGAPHVAKAKN